MSSAVLLALGCCSVRVNDVNRYSLGNVDLQELVVAMAGCKNNGVGTPLELASQTWTHMPSVATVAPPVQLLAVQHRADRERAREVGFVSHSHKIIEVYCNKYSFK